MPKKKVGPTTDEVIDARPDPKPRKHPQLWQSYLLWDELMKMRQRHNLRISSAERGKSQMDVVLEQNFIEHLGLDENLELARKTNCPGR
jgi:fatty-acid desaturase